MIVVALSGIANVERVVQPSKAEMPMEAEPVADQVTDLREVQPSKDDSLIEVTDDGMVASESETQPLNAPTPISFRRC